MKRRATTDLEQWKLLTNRKPLIIRGSRQVGKTYLVENWGRSSFESVVSLNFEQQKGLEKCFNSLDPRKIISALELELNVDIQPGKALLFLDEIQAAPIVISALRYFYEQLPELHVIATGSLLDFTLETIDAAMPVGRVEYYFLHPFSFIEFLEATGTDKLATFLKDLTDFNEITEGIHSRLLEKMREYYFIGGMPAVVQDYAINKNFRTAQRIQSSIVLTLQDDFNKYRRRFDPDLLRIVLNSTAVHPMRRHKYVEISRSHRAEQIKKAFELLRLARLLDPVIYSGAQGIPLSTQAKPDLFKPLFLDIGLCNRLAEVPLLDSTNTLLSIREGELAEQFVGQQLLLTQEPYLPPQLFYWERLSRGSFAEVDYVINSGQEIIPIEVKAGRGTTLRSLHSFLDEHLSVKRAIRFSIRMPEKEMVEGKKGRGMLLSLPLYCAEIVRSFLS
jgi:predicted AAA+ superfamily ATPase